MKKAIAITVAALALAGCGSDSSSQEGHIILHTISYEEMVIAKGYNVAGYTRWNYVDDALMCDIYVMPPEVYGTSSYYNEVVGHEYYCHCVKQYNHPSNDPVCN